MRYNVYIKQQSSIHGTGAGGITLPSVWPEPLGSLYNKLLLTQEGDSIFLERFVLSVDRESVTV